MTTAFRLLLTAAACLPLPASATDALIERCEQPLELHVRRVPSASNAGGHQKFPICGAQLHTALAADSFAPGMKIDFERDADNARLELTMSSSLRANQAIRIDSRENIVGWRGGGPPIEVRVETERGPDLYRIKVENMPAQAFVSRLAEVSGDRIEGIENLGEAAVSLDFEQLPVSTAVQIAAAVAGVQMQQTGARSFRLGKAADVAQIEALLQTRGPQREAALLELLQLARANDANDLELCPDAEVQELIQLRLQRQDFAAARALYQQLLAQSAAREGLPEAQVSTARHGVLLSGLAELELQAGDTETAAALLTRAETVLEASQGSYGEDLPKLLLLQSRLPDNRAQVVLVFGLLERAVSICEQTGAPPETLLPAQLELAALHERTGAWLEAGELYAQIEASLARLRKADDPQLLRAQEGLARSYEKQGRYPQAGALWQKMRSAGASHPETLARALRGLAILGVSSGVPDQAIEAWTQLRALRAEQLGAEHPRTLAAQLELDTLTRLAAVQKGTADAGQPVPAQPLASFEVGAEDPALAQLAPGLQLEFRNNLLDAALTRLSDDLDRLLTMPIPARAGRLEFRAEILLAIGGPEALAGARRDYAAALALRQKQSAQAALTQACAARLTALEKMVGS